MEVSSNSFTGLGTYNFRVDPVTATDSPKDPSSPTGDYFGVSNGGTSTRIAAELYSGPVTYLHRQYLGTVSGEVVIGTDKNDFVNLLGGDDACNAGVGDDVIDGGLGSNFLTGGSGRDVFFLDGRSGGVTWGTITDWEAGEELSLWGWRPGVSSASWVDQAGAAGFTGVTMHADLDGNGSIDASVTWSNMARGGLPRTTEHDGLLWFHN